MKKTNKVAKNQVNSANNQNTGSPWSLIPVRDLDTNQITLQQVDPKFAKEFNRMNDTKRHFEQRHGRCFIPTKKKFLCDGLCEMCKYHKSDDYVSSDEKMPNSEETYESSFVDETVNVENEVIYKEMAEQARKYFAENVEYGEAIYDGLHEGKSVRQIAKELGIPQKTLSDRLKKHRDKLRENTGFEC